MSVESETREALEALVGRTVVAVALDPDSETLEPSEIVLALDDGRAVVVWAWGIFAEDSGLTAEVYPPPPQ